MPNLKTVVLVGNPKPNSRTLDAGLSLMNQLTGRRPEAIIDLAVLGAGILERDNPTLASAIAKVCGADLIVVASPTYKASITGLLKIFLDQIPSNGLARSVAIPIMLGAGPAHSLASELNLRPVLAELGAICPANSIYVQDSSYNESLTAHVADIHRRLECVANLWTQLDQSSKCRA